MFFLLFEYKVYNLLQFEIWQEPKVLVTVVYRWKNKNLKFWMFKFEFKFKLKILN